MATIRTDATDGHDSTTDEASIRVMDALRRLVRVLSASARESPKSDGVSGAQLFLMRQIAAEPGLSIGELVARTLSRQSTVSEVVARLVARGLVARRPGATDARQAKLSLTARGRKAIVDTQPTAQEQLANALSTLPAAQRDMLAERLERWLAAAGFAEVPATMFFEGVEAALPSHPRSARRASRQS
jgi:DNA-binding MarR family transcriptional regulator